MSQQDDKTAAVAASEQPTQDSLHTTQAWSPAQERAAAEARGAELREELALTDLRRAEEDEAKAEEAIEAAKQEESKKERKRREAEERSRAAAEAAERARSDAPEQGTAPGGAVSGAAVAAPGLGAESDPKTLAAASARPASPPSGARTFPPVEGPEKPELHVAAAFAGAFLFARILKKIAE